MVTGNPNDDRSPAISQPAPPNRSMFRLQLSVFALVAASMANLYITQPVLPILKETFSVDMVRVSFTVSAVILGITLFNLPFGLLADRRGIRPIILVGGSALALGGIVCATAQHLWVLIGARFFQGAFIPALTTCLAAYLARTLPLSRLNVVMGAYVAATVVGGMGGRLVGGWVHQAADWRYAFVILSVMVAATTWAACRILPDQPVGRTGETEAIGFFSLVRAWPRLRIYLCAAFSFAAFSSIFNYLPFRLAEPAFGFTTNQTTGLYAVYVTGIISGPFAGRLSSRYGSGTILIVSTILLAGAFALVMVPSRLAIIAGLLGVCTFYFAVHATAVGALNRKLTGGQGRANALYVLFYYAGGWLGITVAGIIYKWGGWSAMMIMCLLMLLMPMIAGIGESRS